MTTPLEFLTKLNSGICEWWCSICNYIYIYRHIYKYVWQRKVLQLEVDHRNNQVQKLKPMSKLKPCCPGISTISFTRTSAAFPSRLSVNRFVFVYNFCIYFVICHLILKRNSWLCSSACIFVGRRRIAFSNNLISARGSIDLSCCIKGRILIACPLKAS